VNVDDYEKKYEAIYTEFAGVVRSVLEKAIAETSGVPRPQSIQCRAKAASHLKPKLQDRGILDSQSIEIAVVKRRSTRTMLVYAVRQLLLAQCISPQKESIQQNAKQNSDRQNARIEHDKALSRVMMAVLKDDTELFKQFSDNESFRRWLTDTVFSMNYESPRPEERPSSTASMQNGNHA